MSDVHREPFLHLVDVAHDRALIAWGAFFFTRTETGRWRILDDEELGRVGRRDSIGSSAGMVSPMQTNGNREVLVPVGKDA